MESRTDKSLMTDKMWVGREGKRRIRKNLYAYSKWVNSGAYLLKQRNLGSSED